MQIRLLNSYCIFVAAVHHTPGASSSQVFPSAVRSKSKIASNYCEDEDLPTSDDASYSRHRSSVQ